MKWSHGFIIEVTSPSIHRLHDFIWHGSDRSNPGRFIPNKLKFTKLRHVPSQIYCNVKDVRTNDDTLITVKLMVFYHLVDVETMVILNILCISSRPGITVEPLTP